MKFISKFTHYALWIGAANILFFLVYGTCNYLASKSTHLYQCYFDWELKIPFLSWMIIPYRSLDWLFIAVYFLPKESIKRFSLQMMMALIPAGIIFLTFPGQCGYIRPDPETLGIFKSIYSVLYQLDKPHNLFPSMHITYAYFAIRPLSEQYKSRLSQGLLWSWMGMICLSIIFTWQHHLIDLVLGLMLGVLIYKYTFVARSVPVTESND